MHEDIRKAIEELEALACDLERQATAWDKEVPSAAARVRALAAALGSLGPACDGPSQAQLLLGESAAGRSCRWNRSRSPRVCGPPQRGRLSPGLVLIPGRPSHGERSLSTRRDHSC